MELIENKGVWAIYVTHASTNAVWPLTVCLNPPYRMGDTEMNAASQQTVKRPYGIQKQQNRFRNVKVCCSKWNILCWPKAVQIKYLSGFRLFSNVTATGCNGGTSGISVGRCGVPAVPWLAVICERRSARCCRNWSTLTIHLQQRWTTYYMLLGAFGS